MGLRDVDMAFERSRITTQTINQKEQAQVNKNADPEIRRHMIFSTAEGAKVSTEGSLTSRTASSIAIKDSGSLISSPSSSSLSAASGNFRRGFFLDSGDMCERGMRCIREL